MGSQRLLCKKSKRRLKCAGKMEMVSRAAAQMSCSAAASGMTGGAEVWTLAKATELAGAPVSKK